RAIARAVESGDQALPGYVLARRAEQALQEGRAETARELAQAAQHGEGRLTPVVHAYAAMKEARAWALDSKPDECKRKLEEATVLFAASAENGKTDEPPWIYFLVEEDLTGHRGMCLADLGEAAKAIDVFDRAIPALPAERIRDRAYYLSWAVKAHVDNHDPEQAAAMARETAHIAIGTGSGDVLQKLRGLHTQLSKTHKDVRAVQELGELLRPPGAAHA
ncbi:MAG: hypothetical protein ACRDYA_24790, partial [Egibacteraceae bacterium]